MWQLSVTVTPEAEEAVTEYLSALFGHSASSYTDLESGLTTVAVYLEKKPPWNALARAELLNLLEKIACDGLTVGPAKVRLSCLPRQDWAESWKQHFRALEVGSVLLVKPSWIRRRPRADQSMIILDPGLSFGTGQHPTTDFCLQQVVSFRPRAQPQSFFDLGTGSGILALAAARLGYSPVKAIDFDPEAVRIARANGRLNGLAGSVDFEQQDVARLSRRPVQTYTLVCANLTADLLIEHRDRILTQMADRSVLVLAGILDREFHLVRRSYEHAGCRLLRSRKKGEWQSGVFRSHRI